MDGSASVLGDDRAAKPAPPESPHRELEAKLAEIRSALEHFESGNAAAGRAALRAITAKGAGFEHAAIEYLSGPSVPGQRALALAMIRNDDVLDSLCSATHAVHAAVEAACVLAQHDRDLDAKIAERLPAAADRNDGSAECVLRMLDRISQGRRLVHMVVPLLEHPNPRLRSKAAVFVGRRVCNTAWAEKRLDGAEPRVRANIIEAFWNASFPDAAEFFHNALQDSDNRVIGNAIYGLYLLGRAEVFSRLRRMAGHSDAAFRATAAWAMAKIADPRFRPVLKALLVDPDKGVVRAALGALKNIRRCEEAQPQAPALAPAVLDITREGAEWLWRVIVAGADGQPANPIPPTGFSIIGPSEPALDYSVVRKEAGDVLTIAFLGGRASCAWKDALDAFLRIKRRQDRVAIPRDGNEARFITDPAAIAAAAESRGGFALRLTPGQTLPGRLIAELRSGAKDRHIVAGAIDQNVSGWEDLMEAAVEAGTTLHVVAEDCEVGPLRELAGRSGGFYLPANGAEETAAAYAAIYTAMRQRYEVRFAGEEESCRLRVTRGGEWGESEIDLSRS